MRALIGLMLCLGLWGCVGIQQRVAENHAVDRARIKEKFPECAEARTRLAMSEPPVYESTPDNMITYRKIPKYPRKKLKAEIEGCTVIQYEITKEGLAENFKVVASTDVDFAEAALKALLDWRFVPQENEKRFLTMEFVLRPPPVP